ncbi:glycosyltransferase family 2 protein [Desemzia sp. RIT804]|uniref:glycosyltransferase family 2 protein n=1 Tax=Desemzia sp. RIT 804 TaxID=2810209 RepID=UPI001950065F|nr:glycosyltransferase family 2 protein [Desemzia sp. RIT 804]MBM6614267.1 glycosyltransferase family 2 protein [Desemzia sp. RIT 804]
MNKPIISVITPVYNAEKYIENTINSVREQTFAHFEMILVDDCSTDNSREVIEKITKVDSRVKYVLLENNSGAAVARNTGIEAAKGRYIAFLDSDDVWKKDKLSQQLNFMEKNHYAFTYTAFETITENGEIIQEKVLVPKSLNYKQLLKNTAIACSTVIIDRSLVGEFSMPLVRKGQDTATWLKLLKGPVKNAYGLNEVLSSYRKVKGSISDDKLSALKRTWNTYRNIEKLPLPKAVYYFTWYVLNAIKKRI